MKLRFQSIEKDQQQDGDSNDEQIRYALEHAPCISIHDHWPWNNDNRGEEFLFVSLLFRICIFRDISSILSWKD